MSASRLELRHHFDHPVRRVWPLVSHTELINRISGMGSAAFEEVPRSDGPPRRMVTMRMGPFRTRYEEVSFEWRYGAWLRSDRRFESGPMRGFLYELTLTPDVPGRWDEGGCTAVATVRVDVRRGMAPLGRLIFGRLKSSFARTWSALESSLAEGHSTQAITTYSMGLDQAPNPPRGASPRTREAIDQALRRIEGQPEGLVEKLRSTLVSADPFDLHRLRPYPLARIWSEARPEVLELFLEATRAGVLTLRWDLLCPHCRGDRRNFAGLGEVTTEGFCAACNLHFDVDLGRNLEAVFTPHPSLRETEPARYCVGGPGANSHLFARHLLTPGDSVTSALRLPKGRYRLRVSGSDETRWVDVDDSSAGSGAHSSLRITDERLEGEDLHLPADVEAELRLENGSGRSVVVVVETSEWIQDILCAAELVSTQRFRSLFGTEALAPGIQLKVERMTVLFTDVVGSTAMYREIGDARAFRLVWSHFDALTEVIAAERGAVVKTIGDAVMATFSDPGSALRAAARFQEAVNRHTEPLGIGPPLTLKIGLAEGPALAVTLNGRLDYFGSTVNLAARVQGKSEGGDILASLEGSRGVEAEELLGALGWRALSESVEAKGFEQRIPVLRFTRASNETPAIPLTGS